MDLNHVVRETLLLAERQIEKGGVTVTVELAPDLPAILGDADTLQQVMLNLVTNARDAVESGGEIRIVTSRREHDRMVELVVADTGRGIAPEDLTADLRSVLHDEVDRHRPWAVAHPRHRARARRHHRRGVDARRGTRFVLAFPTLVPGLA